MQSQNLDEGHIKIFSPSTTWFHETESTSANPYQGKRSLPSSTKYEKTNIWCHKIDKTEWNHDNQAITSPLSLYMKIACFNTYMGKKESLISQLIDSLAFLCWRPILLNWIPRNMIETLSLLQKKWGDSCDYLFLTEILPQDQEKVDMIVEVWWYKQWIRRTSWSKTPLCSLLATKFWWKMISMDKEMVDQWRWCGALQCDRYNIPVYGLHFTLREGPRTLMRKVFISRIKKHLHHSPSVIMIGDFNQSMKQIKKICKQWDLHVQGTEDKTHKILGFDFTARNLDNILIITSWWSTDNQRSLDYQVHRWRSDHAFLCLDIGEQGNKNTQKKRQKTCLNKK